MTYTVSGGALNSTQSNPTCTSERRVRKQDKRFYDFSCVLTEGMKMRGAKGPADVNRHSSDQTVSIGIP